jgi:hypothetical protein
VGWPEEEDWKLRLVATCGYLNLSSFKERTIKSQISQWHQRWLGYGMGRSSCVRKFRKFLGLRAVSPFPSFKMPLERLRSGGSKFEVSPHIQFMRPPSPK